MWTAWETLAAPLDSLERLGSCPLPHDAQRIADVRLNDAAYQVFEGDVLGTAILDALDGPARESESRAQADIFGDWLADPPELVVTNEIRSLAARLESGEAVAQPLRAALTAAGSLQMAEHFASAEHPRGCWAIDQILEQY